MLCLICAIVPSARRPGRTCNGDVTVFLVEPLYLLLMGTESEQLEDLVGDCEGGVLFDPGKHHYD